MAWDEGRCNTCGRVIPCPRCQDRYDPRPTSRKPMYTLPPPAPTPDDLKWPDPPKPAGFTTNQALLIFSWGIVLGAFLSSILHC